MLDATGRLIRLGDQVSIGGGMVGIVVFSIDTGEFSSEFPKVDWAHLGRGIMVQTTKAGLVHLADTDEDVQIISQNSK
ncbi:MAG TPA: hypothetical protein VL971_08430 [Rhizomicrobium sp.]|nr:hypothetical protein [Rhizomicrobium sp.]